MLLEGLWVKDNTCESWHLIGSDIHDRLELYNNKIYYNNLQNGDYGSFYTNDTGYKILTEEEKDELNKKIKKKYKVELANSMFDDFNKLCGIYNFNGNEGLITVKEKLWIMLHNEVVKKRIIDNLKT